MQFWIRHAFLLLTCVTFPFVAALYVDTASEIRRAERAGAVSAKAAAANLEARLTLDAHRNVSAAVSLAQQVTDRDLVGELGKKPGANTAAEKRREAAFVTAADLLSAAAPAGGFAWLVDETGAIVARSDASGPEEAPQLITGHPLFEDTQEGNALDGLWKDGAMLATVGAAPIIVKGQAQGAVMIGTRLDKSVVDNFSKLLGAHLTVIADEQVVATALDPRVSGSVLQGLGSNTEATSSGALTEPLKHEYLPFLPLFIAHDASGFAYTSVPLRVPGTDEVRWVLSVASAEPLHELPERQEIILAGLASFFMLALLIGMINARTFVRPIEKITAHLSELQQGRGELELPEGRVSAPFRRLVRLINMTVQRIPSRTFSTTRASSGSDSPISEIGAPGPSSPLASIPPSPRTGEFAKPELPLEPLAPPAPPPAVAEGRMGIPRTQSVLEKHPFEAAGGDPLADAVASLSRAQSGVGPVKGPSPQKAPPPEESDAIAQAIAALEGQPPPPAARTSGTSTIPPAGRTSPPVPTVPPASTSRGTTSGLEAPRAPTGANKIRSAADIRGVPSESIMTASPFMPSQSEMFRGSTGPLGPRTDAAMDERTPIDQQVAAAAARAHSTGARSGGSLNLASYAGIGQSAPVEDGGFNPEATVVAPVADELLRKSASREDTTDHHAVVPQGHQGAGDMTMVASVPPNLLAQTMGDGEADNEGSDLAGLDAADHAHFKETYERFIEMRKRCGEATGDLAFDRFLAKLAKNREGLVKKYNCRTVRFQVYEKDGKAALKATPVRAR